jgi:hypothetical protein
VPLLFLQPPQHLNHRHHNHSAAFFRAVDATALTGFVMGLLSFGWNEFFRRLLTEQVGRWVGWVCCWV